MAPRWLGPPSEILHNYAAAGTGDRKGATLWVTHLTTSVKCFSTAWGCATYFRLTRPSRTKTFTAWQLFEVRMTTMLAA